MDQLNVKTIFILITLCALIIKEIGANMLNNEPRML